MTDHLDGVSFVDGISRNEAVSIINTLTSMGFSFEGPVIYKGENVLEEETVQLGEGPHGAIQIPEVEERRQELLNDSDPKVREEARNYFQWFVWPDMRGHEGPDFTELEQQISYNSADRMSFMLRLLGHDGGLVDQFYWYDKESKHPGHLTPSKRQKVEGVGVAEYAGQRYKDHGWTQEKVAEVALKALERKVANARRRSSANPNAPSFSPN